MCIAHRGKTGFHIGHKGYLTGELKAGYEVVQEIYLTVQSFDIAETCLGLPAVFGESKLIPGDDIKAEYSSLSPKNKLLSVQVRSIRRSVETRQRGFTVLLRILARRDNCFDFLLAYIKVPLSIPSFFAFHNVPSMNRHVWPCLPHILPLDFKSGRSRAPAVSAKSCNTNYIIQILTSQHGKIMPVSIVGISMWYSAHIRLKYKNPLPVKGAD